MKSINFIPRIIEEKKSEDEGSKTIGQGITKALLEKYKPRDLCDIETLSERKIQIREA